MKPIGWIPILLVGCGGFLGAIARYVVAVFITGRLGSAFPYGTFIINITGCFAIGFFMTLMTESIVSIHDNWRYLFPVGFVGAYTTFSSYEYETMLLVRDGHWLRAATYVVVSTVAGFGAVLLAMGLARRM